MSTAFARSANVPLVFGLLMLSYTRELQLLRKIAGKQSFGRYVLIGASGLAIDLGIFTLLVLLTVAPLPANVASSILGITNNYILNARLNFGNKVGFVPAFRFFSIGLLGMALTTVCLLFLVAAGVSPVIAKVLVLPVLLVAQFSANRAWTFSKSARGFGGE